MDQLLLPGISFWFSSVVCKTEEMWQEGIDQSYLPKLKSIFLPTLPVWTSTHHSQWNHTWRPNQGCALIQFIINQMLEEKPNSLLIYTTIKPVGLDEEQSRGCSWYIGTCTIMLKHKCMILFVEWAVENEVQIKTMHGSFIYGNFQIWLHVSYKTAQVAAILT